jgi:hemerythrin-like domain-containing protein
MAKVKGEEDLPMTPTELLMHEHQIILMVLDGAEREARQMEESGSVRLETVGEMIDFFSNFADRCHHSKEEDLLFVKLEERGMPAQAGPIAVMLDEHEQGRRLTAAIAEALPLATKGDARATAAIAQNLLAYAGLLRAHIGKEDNVLYPMANRLLTAEDQRELMEAFDRVEAEEMGEGVHEKYHELAHKLAEA